MNIQTILYPATDLEQAKAVLTALAGAPTADTPYYVGFDVDGQQIGLVPNGAKQGMTGATPYWHVTDIDATMKALVAAGATVTSEPREVGEGRKTALVTFDGANMIGVLQDKADA